MIQSAGIVVVKFDGQNVRYLMLRARDYWDFPKGKLDEGETHLQAALREAFEEAGVSDLEFQWGHIYTETEPYSKPKKVARYYLAELMSGEPIILPNPETGKKEHDEFRWLTYKEAKKLELHSRIEAVLDWAQSQL